MLQPLRARGICEGNRSDFCRSWSGGCIIGTDRLSACFCSNGYGAQLVGTINITEHSLKYKVHSLIEGTFHEFTCCPGLDNVECGNFDMKYMYHLVFVSNILLFFGFVGLLLATCLWLFRSPGAKITWPTENDRRMLSHPRVQDGPSLHARGTGVPMERWCVTLADFEQFGRLVWQAIQEGRIVPTEEDPFDPDDHTIGPKINTVNDQFIKPVTKRAGGVSWALMLRPEGAVCTLFITHCWLEGIFEFLAKVVHSWPSSTMKEHYAYCCFVSNPQNLDINSLVCRPIHSPFFACLQHAELMMVVPNKKCSIYSRIWCVYEAYLAYSWRKTIFTASPPVAGIKSGVARMFFVCLLGASAQSHLVLFLVQSRGEVMIPDTTYLIEAALYLVLLSIIFFCWRLRGCRSFLIMLAAFVGGMLCAHQIAANPSLKRMWVSALVYATIPMALETDRLRDKQLLVERHQLENGFTGHLRDAKCTVEADRQSILRELTSTDEEAVDDAVHLLITAGMSTPGLAKVAKTVGTLRNTRDWSFANIVLFVGGAGFADPISMFCSTGQAQLLLGPGLTLVWLLTFTRLPLDHVSFAVASLTLWLLVLPIYFVPTVQGLMPGARPMTWEREVLSLMIIQELMWLLILIVSCAGPERLAGVPFLGRNLVRALIGGSSVRFSEMCTATCPSMPINGIEVEDEDEDDVEESSFLISEVSHDGNEEDHNQRLLLC